MGPIAQGFADKETEWSGQFVGTALYGAWYPDSCGEYEPFRMVSA